MGGKVDNYLAYGSSFIKKTDKYSLICAIIELCERSKPSEEVGEDPKFILFIWVLNNNSNNQYSPVLDLLHWELNTLHPSMSSNITFISPTLQTGEWNIERMSKSPEVMWILNIKKFFGPQSMFFPY